MQTTELPEKNEKPARGLRADWPYYVYDHWYIDENGNLAWNMVIHGRRLTDLESMDIALPDPPDISEIEDWIAQNQNMTRERLE